MSVLSLPSEEITSLSKYDPSRLNKVSAKLERSLDKREMDSSLRESVIEDIASTLDWKDSIEGRQYYLDNYCDWLTDEQRAQIEITPEFIRVGEVKIKTHDTERPEALNEEKELRGKLISSEEWKNIRRTIAPEDFRFHFCTGLSDEQTKRYHIAIDHIYKFLIHVLGIKESGTYHINETVERKTFQRYGDSLYASLIMVPSLSVGGIHVCEASSTRLESYREKAS